MIKWKTIRDLPKIIPVDVPDGTSGNWSVETFTVTEEEAEYDLMRSAIKGHRRYTPAGTYKALKEGGQVIMSNTPDEIGDLWNFFLAATGNILINGLGLGVALTTILNKINEDETPAVSSVVVIEKFPDVLSLVSPTYASDGRVRFIQADAFEYKPMERFESVWHDIWTGICSDNLKDIHTLHRKYGRKTSWQGSWGRDLCEYQLKRGW
jgi:hypothetical protein